MAGISIIMVGMVLRGIALKRRDDKRSGEVGAEDREEEEFALGIHVGKLCEILAQVAFGKQVRKERRHAARHRAQGRNESAGAALGSLVFAAACGSPRPTLPNCLVVIVPHFSPCNTERLNYNNVSY